MDLFSSYVRLIPTLDNTAETVVECIKQHVLFDTGAFISLRTDAAGEFRSRIARLLYERLNLKHTHTMGYNPRGNAKAERFHLCLGNCLRMLDDNAYAAAHNECKAICHAWNVTVSESIGCSPFELHHGVKARSIPEIKFLDGDEPPAHAHVLMNVQRHAAMYIKLARTHGNYVREMTALKLNRVSSRKAHKLGDLVMVHIPPGQLEIARRRRKAKHLPRFIGPGRVIKIISPTSYRIKMVNTDDEYERNMCNIRPFPTKCFVEPGKNVVFDHTDRVVDAKDATVYTHKRYKRGTIVAVLDREGDKQYRVASVLSSSRKQHRVHFYATEGVGAKRKRLSNKTLRTQAKYFPAYVDTGDGKLIIGKHNARRCDVQPWTAHIDTEARLVIAADLLFAGSRLAPASVKKIPTKHLPHVSR